MVALASAFVKLRPSVDQAEFTREGQKAGQAAGAAAGKTYADGFYRDSAGKLRQANGRFATDAQKAMLGAGGAAGRGFGENFHKSGGGIIKKGFTKLKGELGPLLVPLGIGAAVAAIGSIGMTYEDNLNIFQSVTKATGRQMDQVAAKARALGADVTLPGVSAAGAAAAMTELSKANFTVQQSMDGAIGTLRLARAAGIDEARAATIAANAVNAFGISAKDVTFVADELAAAANSSSVEVTDMSDSFQMAAAVFASFQGQAVGGKEAITELNTAIAILGNNGIKGSDAGTSLKQMMLQLTGPTAQAKDLMKELAFRAGGATISLDQQNAVLHGSKSVREEALGAILKSNKAMGEQGDIAFTAAGKMRSLPQIIDLVTRGTKGMSDEERDYAVTQIFGTDASRSVIALMKGGLPVYEEQRKAVLRQGAAADVAAAKNKGLRGAIDNVKSQMENAAISIYNVVKGPLTTGLNAAASALSPLAGGIQSLGAFVRRNSGVIGGFAAVIGGGAAAFVALRLAVLAAAAAQKAWLVIQTAVAFVQLASQVRSFAGAWALLDAAMAANPIGLVVVALGALVAGLVYAYRHSETFRRIVDAAWHGIVVAAKWAWETVLKPIFTAYAWYITRVVVPAVLWLWHNVIQPAFHAIARIVQAAWVVIQIIFAAWKKYIEIVVAPVVRWLWHNVVEPVFRNIGNTIRFYWDKVIKPVFSALGSFIRDHVAPAFRTGVSAIAKAWDKLREAARKPVAFVVNHIINPFIGGINKAAAIFGVKDRIAPIAGFRDGGLLDVPGYDKGGRISGLPSRRDNRLAPAAIPGVGAVKLAGGEFIVNAADTAKALPLLRWINDGMKGGAGRVARYLGRPLADMPGDGSEGWAFADGGLVGWVKDVWGAISNPLATIKRPFENALRSIPAAGMIRDFLIGGARKLLGMATGWLTGGGGGSVPLGGRLGAAAAFLRAQNGKPYVWASAGPNGFDCSGIVSAVYNVLNGRNPYNHTFSTESLPGPWFRQGQRTGPLLAGWSHPGQSPASASVGHMAGQLAGLPFESRGSAGVILGPRARSVGQFANIGAARFAGGGLFGEPIQLFDRGGYWPSGTLGANLSGRTEYVSPDGAGAATIVLNNYGVIGSQGELDDWLAKSVRRLKRDRKLL